MNPYLGSSNIKEKEMLNLLGLDNISELIQKAIPENLHTKNELSLPESLSELGLTDLVEKIATRNFSRIDYLSFLGAGFYDHYIPAIVDYLISLPGFLTAYTPYQPEASQGTLTALFEFQSLMARLTGMEIASAALYDGATALAESALFAQRISGNSKKKLLIAESVNPFYKKVLYTYLRYTDIQIVELENKNGIISNNRLEKELDSETFAFVYQSPNFYGIIEDPIDFKNILDDTLLIAVSNPTSLAVLKPPGEFGADIVVGESQSMGIHLNYGGPGLGYLATKKKYMRKLPGRIVGESIDNKGQRAFVLILQTREQHIRRADATSNVCTNETLIAIANTIYLSLLGEIGLKEIANLSFQKAHYLADKLNSIEGFQLLYDKPFFNEFALKVPMDNQKILEDMLKKRIIAGYPIGKDTLLLSVTEKTTKEDMDYLAKCMKEVIR